MSDGVDNLDIDVESDYVPMLIREARDRNLSDEATRMIVGFEIAGQNESLFGVDYVAGEMGEADATDERKVNMFISDVIQGIEDYRDNYERIEEKYGDAIDVLLS